MAGDHSAAILAVLDQTTDITLDELRRHLTDKGLSFGDGTARRFHTCSNVTCKTYGRPLRE